MESIDIRYIATTWAQRAQAELGAEKRFRQLTEELVDLGANSVVVSLSRKAQNDENRHAFMCAKVAKSYGHSTGFEFFSPQPTKIEKSWKNRVSEEEQLLCEITLMCCITETINASLLNSIYGHSKSSPTQKVIQQILKDEVKHSQIGWAHLAHESKRRDCKFLGDYLGEMLEISVKDELFLPVATEAHHRSSFEHGVMPIAHRLEQFTETMKEVVLPGFEAFGIDTLRARSWLNKKAKAPAGGWDSKNIRPT